jgi:hypothetical protein
MVSARIGMVVYPKLSASAVSKLSIVSRRKLGAVGALCATVFARALNRLT